MATYTDDMTKAELLKAAKDIEGHSSMNKDELIAALNKSGDSTASSEPVASDGAPDSERSGFA